MKEAPGVSMITGPVGSRITAPLRRHIAQAYSLFHDPNRLRI